MNTSRTTAMRGTNGLAAILAACVVFLPLSGIAATGMGALLSEPIFRGVMTPFVPNEGDLRDAAELGANIVRFQMTPDGFMKKPSKLETDAEKLAWFDTWLAARLDELEGEILPWSRKYGLKVVIDLHEAPGSREPDSDGEMAMFHNAVFADRLVTAWKEIAARFAKDSDAIYGYNIFSEPVQKRKADDGCDLWTLQKRAAEAIREKDPTTPVVFEVGNWDLPDGFLSFKPIPVSNAIYSVHIYEPHAFTHQKVRKLWPHECSYPGKHPTTGKWIDRDWLRKNMAPVVAFQREYGARIFVGEFSAVAWADGADRYIADVIALMEEHGWDWTYHAWREWPGWSVEHEYADGTFRPAKEETARMKVLRRALSANKAAH